MFDFHLSKTIWAPFPGRLYQREKLVQWTFSEVVFDGGGHSVQVGSRLLLVKPLYKRLSSSISSKSLPAPTASKKWDDDEYLDFQPKCLSLGRSRKWVFSSFDERARRKQYNCFACVLHIWKLTACDYNQVVQATTCDYTLDFFS